MIMKKTDKKPYKPWSLENSLNEEITMKIRSLDVIARIMEKKWGPGRLPTLMKPETEEKFYLAQQNLGDAVHQKNYTLVCQKVDNLIKGYKLMNQKAIDLGYEPQSAQNPVIWYHQGPNQEKYAFVAEQKDIKQVPENAVDRTWTLDELCHVIKWYLEQKGSDKVMQFKDQFPGSVINDIRSPDPNDNQPEFEI